MTDIMTDELAAPQVVDRSSFQRNLDALRSREKAHTDEGDAMTAAGLRLPIVEMDPSIRLIGQNDPVTLLDAYFMWHTVHPAPEPCDLRGERPVPRFYGLRDALVLGPRVV